MIKLLVVEDDPTLLYIVQSGLQIGRASCRERVLRLV